MYPPSLSLPLSFSTIATGDGRMFWVVGKYLLRGGMPANQKRQFVHVLPFALAGLSASLCICPLQRKSSDAGTGQILAIEKEQSLSVIVVCPASS
ncbi:hypothetical protein FA10DRAFT_266257, partial [Acaromyces ingoldii]